MQPTWGQTKQKQAIGSQAIDGRPHFAKLSIDDGKQEEIAAIDPDFEWDVAPVPDGMS